MRRGGRDRWRWQRERKRARVLLFPSCRRPSGLRKRMRETSRLLAFRREKKCGPRLAIRGPYARRGGATEPVGAGNRFGRRWRDPRGAVGSRVTMVACSQCITTRHSSRAFVPGTRCGRQPEGDYLGCVDRRGTYRRRAASCGERRAGRAQTVAPLPCTRLPRACLLCAPRARRSRPRARSERAVRRAPTAQTDVRARAAGCVGSGAGRPPVVEPFREARCVGTSHLARCVSFRAVAARHGLGRAPPARDAVSRRPLRSSAEYLARSGSRAYPPRTILCTRGGVDI